MTLLRRLAPLLLIAVSLLASTAHAAEEAILLIDQTSGNAGVQRNGKRLALVAGDALQEQDLIVTDRSGRMTLRLGRHGFVEVGPNAEVGIERLPFAAYARDLKSIFSVSKGYFRVVWKHPQLSSSWPLYVYMAGHRISLVSGEYFFQNLGNEQRACVAAGQIALQAAGSDSVETIKPPSCARFAANNPPQVTGRNPDDWIAVRRGFSIEATASTLLAQESLPPLPAPVVPARPIINTSPTPQIYLPAPTAILSAETAAADSSTQPLGPVIARPSLPPATSPAPRSTPALPTSAPRPAPAATVAGTTAPIIIGQVQSSPVLSAPATAPAPVFVAPKPSVAVPAPQTGNGTWALNIASYSDAAIAEREAAKLRAAGYASAGSQPATVNGKPWHRVQLTGFTSEAAARSAALELKSKLGLQNIWVLKP